MSRFLKPSAMLTDAFGALVVRGLGIILIFASTTVLARVLGPTEYGTYSAALALALLLATLAPMGSDRILVRNLSIAKDSEQAGTEIAIAHLCSLGVSVVMFAGAIFSWWFNRSVLENHKWAQTSLLAAILFGPLTVTYLRQWAAIPLIGARRAVIPEQTFLPLVFTSTVLVAKFSGLPLQAESVAGIYATVMLGVWVGSLRTHAVSQGYHHAWTSSRSVSAAVVWRRIVEGLPFVSVAVGSVLSQTCMPLVIAATCGFNEAAYFALAMPYAALPAIPLGVFNLSMITRCTRHFQRGEFAEANHAVRSASTATFVLSALISISIWLCSPWLISILGEDYRPVCQLFPPLLLAAMVDCLTGPTIPVMQTMRLEKSYTRALLAYIPVQLGLVFWLGRTAGIEGAATAYLLARCFWNILIFVRIYQTRGLIMLPYLRVTTAMHEWSAVPVQRNGPIRQPHESWPAALSLTESTARAA